MGGEGVGGILGYYSPDFWFLWLFSIFRGSFFGFLVGLGRLCVLFPGLAFWFLLLGGGLPWRLVLAFFSRRWVCVWFLFGAFAF